MRISRVMTKGGAKWQSVPSCDVERMCGYVTDDGAVAAYFHIPREDVARIRAAIRKDSTPDPCGIGCSSDSVNASTAVARDAAEAGSERLLAAIQRLFTTFEHQHGLRPGEGKLLQLHGYRA